ncbi:MAG: glycosyltransferase family 4 protein [Acidobacteriota bacterium]
MKIAINGILLNFNRKTDGIGRYIASLLREFEAHKEHTFYVFVDRLYKYKELKNGFEPDNIVPVFIPLPVFSPLLRKIWTFWLMPLFASFIRIEVCFAPDGFLPAWGFKKYVTTIHDLAFIKYPETVTSQSLKMLRDYYGRAISKSDKVITVSNCSKEDILKYYDIPESKVEVVYNGSSEIFFQEIPSEECRRLSEKFDISEPYLFYYGKIEPRKNLVSVVKAFTIVKEKHQKLKLMIAGREGWLSSDLHEMVEKNSWKDDIKFLGPLSDLEIKFLLENALAFIYIPLYEGFGLPVVEAMACGANIITSNVSSIPEVVGDCGIVVQPENIQEIAHAVLKLIEECACGKKSNLNAVERAGKFNWKDSAKRHIQIMNDLIS